VVEPPAGFSTTEQPTNERDDMATASDDGNGLPDPSDPMAVWDDLKAVWESLDIEDADAVEEWATCVLNEGEQQAKRLTDALADRVA
jgi:hypothetical protein